MTSKTIKPVKSTKPKPAFKTCKDAGNQGIVLFNSADLKSIRDKSGPLTKQNEYQVHYWALVFRHKAADDSILDIAIPTTFFNYEQTVSSAHIDFELTDVDDVSDAVLPIHNMKAREILDSNFKNQLEARFGVKFEVFSSPLSQSHKHPS